MMMIREQEMIELRAGERERERRGLSYGTDSGGLARVMSVKVCVVSQIGSVIIDRPFSLSP